MRRTVIYLNLTDNEEVNQRAMTMLEKYCRKNELEIVAMFGENTEDGEMSFVSRFACVGMMTDEDVSVVVTAMASMIGNDDETIINNLLYFMGYDIEVETLTGDIDHYYKKLYDESADDEEISLVSLLRNIRNAD